MMTLRRIALIVAIVSLAPGATFAQDAVRPAPVMNPGPTVFVQDDRGVETKGKLLKLDTKEVVILVDAGERRFEIPRVRKVEKRGDSLKNGAIIGAVVGVAAGLFAAGGLAGEGGEAAVFVLTSTAFYTAIGVGIDALIQGRTTLYQAPTVTARVTRPQSKQAGISLSLRW